MQTTAWKSSHFVSPSVAAQQRRLMEKLSGSKNEVATSTRSHIPLPSTPPSRGGSGGGSDGDSTQDITDSSERSYEEDYMDSRHHKHQQSPKSNSHRSPGKHHHQEQQQQERLTTNKTLSRSMSRSMSERSLDKDEEEQQRQEIAASRPQARKGKRRDKSKLHGKDENVTLSPKPKQKPGARVAAAAPMEDRDFAEAMGQLKHNHEERVERAKHRIHSQQVLAKKQAKEGKKKWEAWCDKYDDLDRRSGHSSTTLAKQRQEEESKFAAKRLETKNMVKQRSLREFEIRKQERAQRLYEAKERIQQRQQEKQEKESKQAEIRRKEIMAWESMYEVPSRKPDKNKQRLEGPQEICNGVMVVVATAYAVKHSVRVAQQKALDIMDEQGISYYIFDASNVNNEEQLKLLLEKTELATGETADFPLFYVVSDANTPQEQILYKGHFVWFQTANEGGFLSSMLS